MNRLKSNKLERKDYNLEYNFRELKPENFEYDEITCGSCGILSSDNSGKKDKRYAWINDLKWFECSQCEKEMCSRCLVDAEFWNDLRRLENGELEFVEPFIDKGKCCFNCLEHLVGRVELWRVLKENNVLIKDEKVLATQEDQLQWDSF